MSEKVDAEPDECDYVTRVDVNIAIQPKAEQEQ